MALRCGREGGSGKETEIVRLGSRLGCERFCVALRVATWVVRSVNSNIGKTTWSATESFEVLKRLCM